MKYTLELPFIILDKRQLLIPELKHKQKFANYFEILITLSKYKKSEKVKKYILAKNCILLQVKVLCKNQQFFTS